MHNATCPLCGPAPVGLLHEDAQLRIITVDDAQFPGYLRVIWRDHVSEMTDLSQANRDRLMLVVYRLEALQRDILQPDKINLASLGNQVPHLHWHLIPRWRGDPCFPDSIWATSQAHDQDRQTAWARQQPALLAQASVLQNKIRQEFSPPD
ncbi:HIT family protein [Castellaniella sp.]|uniref:HIT family protein n=1 Tax=Castellaniella sp. TaxID=1955812 RepID=UPI002AFFE7CF|nr:HIT family protein [Castellaniella sp.]